jgi:hypothetical protein
VRLPLPSPVATVAPATTTTAPASTRPDGRDRASTGPTRARITGTVPMTVPTRVALACREASMTNTLNSTSPVAARARSRSSSRRVGRGKPRPMARATAARIRAATA